MNEASVVLNNGHSNTPLQMREKSCRVLSITRLNLTNTETLDNQNWYKVGTTVN